MSLVDYDDDDDDDYDDEEEEDHKRLQAKEEEEKTVDSSTASLPLHPDRQNQEFMSSSSDQLPNPIVLVPSPQMEKLPDASLLFSSPSFPFHQTVITDHSSMVAAAFAASESRKRESNGSALTHPRTKVPRGPLPHSRNIPDVAGGKLIPPQLHGRSNVVTEDINKLFVRKDAQIHLRRN